MTRSSPRRTSTHGGTSTSQFGVGKRENHDAGDFYARFSPPQLSADETLVPVFELEQGLMHGDARHMGALPDGSVALVVTSPPYFAGKAYEQALGERGIPASYLEYLALLRDVFAECRRALEPGGRMAVNVANLGRKPYRSLAADVIRILQDDLGLLLRGEVVWAKAEGAAGSCAWGSFRSATNPVLRDITERVIVASKGRFDRAGSLERRRAEGLPCESWISSDEFMEATLDLWRIPPASAKRVGHPAPFPVELPLRLIDLYTFRGDLVLDPFLGSGATAVAAARRGRRWAGYDTDGGYVDLARSRVERELRDGVPAAPASPGRGRRLVRPGGSIADEFQARATEAGQAIAALAPAVLERAGFRIRHRQWKVPGLGLIVSLVGDDVLGQPWYFDLTGAFTSTRDGLVREDTLWKCLGRASVLSSRGIGPVVLLTSHLPAKRSAGDEALRAVGPHGVHDAIEILSSEGQQRLADYAKGWHRNHPRPGYWHPGDLVAPR